METKTLEERVNILERQNKSLLKAIIHVADYIHNDLYEVDPFLHSVTDYYDCSTAINDILTCVKEAEEAAYGTKDDGRTTE